MTDFGKGPTLEQASAWLRDEAERIDRILDVTERNSVIEGLPPLLGGDAPQVPRRAYGRRPARASACRIMSASGPYCRLKAAFAASM